MSETESNVWPQPSRLKTWSDPTGRVWRRVGDRPMSLKSARRAFDDDANVVVLFYGMTPAPVDDPTARAELWSRIERSLRGRPDHPHSDLKVIRYRDEDGSSMLAVEESC